MTTFQSPSAHVSYWRKLGNTCPSPGIDCCTDIPEHLIDVSGTGAALGPLIRPRFGIAGIKTLNLILPHLHEDTGG
jgi:hypothetical protein